MFDGVEGCDEEVNGILRLAWHTAGVAMGQAPKLPAGVNGPQSCVALLLCTIAETGTPEARRLLAEVLPRAAQLVSDYASTDEEYLRQTVGYFAHLLPLEVPEAAAPYVVDLFRAIVRSLEQPMSFEEQYLDATDNTLLSAMFFLTVTEHASQIADASEDLALRGWRACMAHLPAVTDRKEGPRIHLLFAKAAISGNYDAFVQHGGPAPATAREAHPSFAHSNSELCLSAAAGILTLAGRDPEMVPDAAIGGLRQLLHGEADQGGPM